MDMIKRCYSKEKENERFSSFFLFFFLLFSISVHDEKKKKKLYRLIHNKTAEKKLSMAVKTFLLSIQEK